MDPRISFSSDFVDTQQQATKYENSYREAPVSSDFEFTIRNDTMIPADEIFFKGVMLPLKEKCTSQLKKMTLRDELLVDDDDDDDHYELGNALSRLPRSPSWWKDKLGFRKVHGASKRSDGHNGVLERVVEERRLSFNHGGEGLTSKRAQDTLVDGGFSCKSSET